MLRRMWIGSLNLYEALGADQLIAATGFVKIGRVINEADGAFDRVFVKKHFERLPIDIRILGKLYLSRCHISLRGVFGSRKRCECFRSCSEGRMGGGLGVNGRGGRREREGWMRGREIGGSVGSSREGSRIDWHGEAVDVLARDARRVDGRGHRDLICCWNWKASPGRNQLMFGPILTEVIQTPPEGSHPSLDLISSALKQW